MAPTQLVELRLQPEAHAWLEHAQAAVLQIQGDHTPASARHLARAAPHAPAGRADAVRRRAF